MDPSLATRLAAGLPFTTRTDHSSAPSELAETLHVPNMPSAGAHATIRLDKVPGGLSGDPLRPDNIVYAAGSLWAQPRCIDVAKEDVIASALPPIS
jgi:hypothetical protein